MSIEYEHASVNNSLLSYALACLDAGVVPLPVSEDGEKKPDLKSWRDYQTRLPARIEVKKWFGRKRSGLGIVCGKISRNLEVLDFDNYETFLDFLDLARAAGMGEQVDRLYRERTPRPGAHFIYRCETIEGNQKLAFDSAKKAIIETRGEGGFCIVAPSNGKVHETGKPYVLISGSLATIPIITPQERSDLFNLARSFNQVIEEPETARQEQTDPHGDRPGDLYNAQATWEEILEPHGWKLVFNRNGVGYWRRPGKDRGVSASTDFGGSGFLYVFSTSTPFEAERGYSKFSAYALLNFGNDFTKAAKTIQVRTVSFLRRKAEERARQILEKRGQAA